MLHVYLAKNFPQAKCTIAFDETTLELNACDLLDTMRCLRDDPKFYFCQLTDVTAVDYLTYKKGDWLGEAASREGFSRARNTMPDVSDEVCRFAVIYHLLSHHYQRRLRVRVRLCELNEVPSITSLWPSAAWAEREVYDLFGLIFTDHPSLTRILTDYGFIGHPFRKDFPLSGNYEVRYDAASGAVISEPTDHFARVEVGKIVRLEEAHG